MWCRELEKNNTTLKHRYSDCPIKMTTFFIRELSDMLLFETMALHHVFFVTCLFHCLSKFSSSYSSVAGGERAHTLSPVLTVTSTLETSLSNTSVLLVPSNTSLDVELQGQREGMGLPHLFQDGCEQKCAPSGGCRSCAWACVTHHTTELNTVHTEL